MGVGREMKVEVKVEVKLGGIGRGIGIEKGKW